MYIIFFLLATASMQLSASMHLSAIILTFGPSRFLASSKLTIKERALLDATKKDKNQEVKFLLESSVNPNIQDEHKYTPLHLAIKWSNSEVVKILLAHGADPTMKNSKGQTALDLVKDKNSELASLLRPCINIKPAKR